MRTELTTRRRALRVTYRRYIEADRAWRGALDEMKEWFPTASRPNRAAIGNPGSEVRRLYDSRARALVLFEAAHVKFDTARARLDPGPEDTAERDLLPH
ncbi:MAG: hypothetical protein CML68_22920 [Rhodobacteraceae bacterium]|nr:hypothetical protein [Paracoccaceae bacterium]